MTRTVMGNNVELKADEGCAIVDIRNQRQYSVVVCTLKNEKHFFEQNLTATKVEEPAVQKATKSSSKSKK